MKKIILLFTLCIVFVSCSNDDNSKTEATKSSSLLTKINVPFGLKPILNNENYLETFEYDASNRITRRNGGFGQLPPAMGIPYFFTNNFYDEIDYTNNTVNVTTYSITNNVIEKIIPEVKFTLQNSTGKINYREIIYDHEKKINMTNNKKETFIYENDKISEIRTTFPNQTNLNFIFTETEKFYYDTNGNLTKTEYQEFVNGNVNSELTVQLFENYDNSPNPFTNLIYIGDFFYRSLSTNNFRKYTKITYQGDGKTPISEEQMNWDPTYDSKGNIILYIEK